MTMAVIKVSRHEINLPNRLLLVPPSFCPVVETSAPDEGEVRSETYAVEPELEHEPEPEPEV